MKRLHFHNNPRSLIQNMPLWKLKSSEHQSFSQNLFNSAWKEVLSSFNICFQGNLSLALPAPFRNCSMLCFLFSVFFLCNIHFESISLSLSNHNVPTFLDPAWLMSHASWLKDENMCNLKFFPQVNFGMSEEWSDKVAISKAGGGTLIYGLES